MNAREEILRRVRRAVGDMTARPEVPRRYRREEVRHAGHPELLDQLVDRLRDYGADVVRCAPEGVAGAVADALAGRVRVVVPGGLPSSWLAAWVRRPGVVPLADEPMLTVHELDAADAVVTGCAVAVAETGTLVLDTGPGQGRRALTLVPDHHVCVVRAAQVVGGVPAALARLDPTRPLTFISGPSATSDIELHRVEGVHGPRRLAVVVVGAAGHG